MSLNFQNLLYLCKLTCWAAPATPHAANKSMFAPEKYSFATSSVFKMPRSGRMTKGSKEVTSKGSASVVQKRATKARVTPHRKICKTLKITIIEYDLKSSVFTIWVWDKIQVQWKVLYLLKPPIFRVNDFLYCLSESFYSDIERIFIEIEIESNCYKCMQTAEI